MSDDELKAAIEAYRKAADALSDEVRERFPIGSRVIVNCPGRYRGPGVSSGIGTSHATVSVLLGNGNTWDYPIESVRRAP